MAAVPTFDAETIARHAEAVRRLAHRLVWNQVSAEDVAQDALVAALELRTPPRQGLGPWIQGVTRKLAANSQRKERRLKERHARAGAPTPAPAPDEVVERLRAQRLVGDALMAVGEPYRQALYMRHFEDLPPRTIAERLGLPVNTVRTHLRRGRAKLREEIEARSDKRRPWQAALVPLLAPRVPNPTPLTASAATGLGGTLLMLATSRYAIVLLAVLLFGGGFAYVTLGDSGDPAVSVLTETGKASRPPEAPELKGVGKKTSVREGADAETVAAPTTVTSTALPVIFAGHVLDPQGRALAGVPVNVHARRAPAVPVAGTESDAQGRFEIQLDAALARKALESKDDWLNLRVAASHPRWLFAAASFDVSANEEHARTRTHHNIELRFQETFRVRCRVVDEAGWPIAGATCRWGGYSDYTPWPDGRYFEAATDPDGYAELEIPVVEDPAWVFLRTTGVKHVHAEAEGRARGISQPIHIVQPTPGRFVEAEIVLPTAHTIAGRVVDDHGDALPDLLLQVALHRRGTPSLYWHEDLGNRPRTGPNGTFTLEDVPAGPWAMDVWVSGYADLQVPIEVPSQPVTVTLARKTTISVYYRRPDGSPLRANLYHAIRQGEPPFSPYGHGRGNDPLLFDRLRPGRYRITVNLVGRLQPFVHELELLAGLNDAKTLTVPQAEGQAVEGRLLDAQGRPVAGMTILRREGADLSHEHPVDARGTFRFEGLTPGSYILWAGAEGHVGEERFLEVGHEDLAPVVVRLGHGATIRVRLPRKPPDAMFRWQLQLRTANGDTLDVVRLKPDEDDWLELSGLPVGALTVMLESTSFRADQVADDTYVAVLDCAEGETVECAFPRESGVTLEGYVLGADGKPRAQHALCLYRVAPDLDPRKGVQYTRHDFKDVFTDGEGRFEAQGLLPGRYITVGVLQGDVPFVVNVTGVAEQTVELRAR